MAIHHRTGDDMGSGQSFLTEPGWYHMAVTDATDRVTKRSGELIDGAMFRVDCTVFAGTTPGCRDKTKDLIFFHPKPDAKDGGEFGRRIIDRAFIAMNAIRKDQTLADVEIEPADLVGQQFIVQLSKRGDDGKYLEIAYADIYHVDDPDVAGQPKDKEMLGIIKAADRWVGGRPKAPSAPPAPQPAASGSAVDINKLDF